MKVIDAKFMKHENKSIPFAEDPPRHIDGGAHDADSFLLNIEGYEGPIEVLLEMARKQKVDLLQVSILQLARQYLQFIERAKEMSLDLAAEYLVMAAWLAYLKSRLLLPQEATEGEPTAEEMAEALQFQLRRLEAMQKAAENLRNRPQLGQGIFARGAPEGLSVKTINRWDVGLYDMLAAYGDITRRSEGSNYDLPVFHLMSAEAAMERLGKMLGALPRKGMKSVWATLHSFLPEGKTDRIYIRSALASTLAAGLEMVKQGRLEMRQDAPFRPVYMRETALSNEVGNEASESEVA